MRILSFVMSVRPSVCFCMCPSALNNSASSGQIFINFYFWVFLKIFRENAIIIKIWQQLGVVYKKIYVHLQEELCTFTRGTMYIYKKIYVHLQEDLCTFTRRTMYIYKKIYVHLQEDLCTFTRRSMYIYENILLNST